eukprot:798836-Prymnesium_polylepis.1
MAAWRVGGASRRTDPAVRCATAARSDERRSARRKGAAAAWTTARPVPVSYTHLRAHETLMNL